MLTPALTIPVELTQSKSMQIIGYNGSTYSYSISTCPSIGFRNDLTKGSLSGKVLNKDSLPISNIVIDHINDKDTMHCGTNDIGTFSFRSVNVCASDHKICFKDQNGNLISDTVIKVEKLTFGQNLSLIIELNKYQITDVMKKNTEKAAKNVRLINTQAGCIVISVSDEWINKQGEIQIYSLNGILVRKIPFTVYGSGTYTINWDGRNRKNQKVPVGIYTCRVLIENELTCKGLINW